MLEPMLAEKAPAPFDSARHIFERKWDGTRCLAHVDQGRVRLWGRSGADYTATFPELQGLTGQVRADDVLLDGEIVVLTGEVADFRALQSRVHRSNATQVWIGAQVAPVTYMVFDILRVRGVDLTALRNRVPLEGRRRLLEQLLDPSDRCRLTGQRPDGIAFFKECIRAGHEGIMAKDRQGLYYPGRRHPAWLKVKGVQEDSFIVCGLTWGEGWRQGLFGALILGKPDNGGLRYCGSVGTGFTEQDLAQILYLLHELHTDRCPFPQVPDEPKLMTWVEPILVVDVKYHAETPDRRLRFPVFIRVRLDLSRNS